MYLVHQFLLMFLVILNNHWITFTYGFLNEKELSFKPTLIAVDNTTGDVYAAGSGYLARLNSNLTLISRISTSSCKTCNITVLEIDYRTRNLLVCAVSDQGACRYHDLNNTSNMKMLISPNGKGGTIGRNGNVVALFLPPSQERHSELVVGISQPLETQIDLLSFRKITSEHLTYLNLGRSVEKLQISDEFRKDVKVQFVYGFQFKDGLYFLVNKRGNNGTASWLFRICSKDKSVFPFIAIPLSCQDFNHEMYHIGPKYNLTIAAKYYEHPSHESLVVSFGYNRDKETHIPNEKFGSAVCTFTMEEITREMNFVKSRCGPNEFVFASKWIMGHGTVGYRDGENSSCKHDYNSALEILFEGIHKKPDKIEKKKLITSVIPFPVDDKLHIIMSTNHGDLYYYREINTSYPSKNLGFDFPHNKNLKKGFLADVEINTATKTAYTITENKIVRISLDFCERHVDCDACVLGTRGFNCVWFKGKCFAADRNTGGLENTCPPEITSIYPNHGITSGSNPITIYGHYLGDSEGAFRSVQVCKTPCNVVVKRSNSTQIECKTESVSEEQQCAITVNITDTARNPHMRGSVTSGDNPKLYFNFKSVSITSYNPELGPESGGTNITVIGENLYLTKRVEIKMKNSSLVLPCRVISSNDTLLLCTTQSFKQTQQNRNTNESIGCGKILLMIENDVIAETNGTFCYWKDPQITNVFPRRSIKSGGLNVSVEGTNLNVIANPRLGLTLDNNWIQPEAEDCEVRSSTMMICKTPKLTPSGASTSGYIYMYFIMDGVEELKEFANNHPNLSEFKVNPDPEFSSTCISEDGLVDSLIQDISIKGTNIKESKVDGEDIQVTLTSATGINITCPIVKLDEETVSCAPQLNETRFEVQVKVGNRYYNVGNIIINAKSKTPDVADLLPKITQYAIIVGVGVAVLICTILIVCLIWFFCGQKKEDKTKQESEEMYERYTTLK